MNRPLPQLQGMDLVKLWKERSASMLMHLPKHAEGLRPTSFTCDTCSDVVNCPSRFDWYSTDGDCLEDK